MSRPPLAIVAVAPASSVTAVVAGIVAAVSWSRTCAAAPSVALVSRPRVAGVSCVATNAVSFGGVCVMPAINVASAPSTSVAATSFSSLNCIPACIAIAWPSADVSCVSASSTTREPAAIVAAVFASATTSTLPGIDVSSATYSVSARCKPAVEPRSRRRTSSSTYGWKCGVNR